MDHEGAGHALEEFAGQVNGGAVAAGGHVQLAGVGLGVIEHRLQVVARKILASHQDHGNFDQGPHRLKIHLGMAVLLEPSITTIGRG